MLVSSAPAANISSINNFANPKQIVATTSTYGTVMYTVPSGKKFMGFVWGSGQTNVVSGGVSIPTLNSTSSPMVLTSGSSVVYQAFGNQGYVLGVETDA